MSIQGFELFDIEPDFATLPQIRGNRLADRIAFSEANLLVSYRGKHPTHSLYFDFVLQSAAEIRELEDFFYDRKGKWQPFWVPSWHGEIFQRADLLSSGNSLSIEPVDYALTWEIDPDNVFRLGNYIFLYHQDGTLWTPQVTGVSGTDPEVLLLGEAATKDWNVGECVIGFLYFVRFLQDELNLSHSGLNAATTKLAMTEIINIVAEDDVLGDPEIEGIAFYDHFDSYSVGATANLNKGWGWLSSWNIEETEAWDIIFDDDLSSYTASSAVNGTTIVGKGGSGTFVAS
jgi:hypothetical protein